MIWQARAEHLFSYVREFHPCAGLPSSAKECTPSCVNSPQRPERDITQPSDRCFEELVADKSHELPYLAEEMCCARGPYPYHNGSHSHSPKKCVTKDIQQLFLPFGL